MAKAGSKKAASRRRGSRTTASSASSRKASPKKKAARPAATRKAVTRKAPARRVAARPASPPKAAARKPPVRGVGSAKKAARPRAAAPSAAAVVAAALGAAVRYAYDVPRVRGAGRQAAPAAAPVVAAAAAGITVGERATRRMIVLPPRGLRANGPDVELATRTLISLGARLNAGNISLSSLGPSALALAPAVANATSLRVIDSVAENGAKLIEMNPGEEGALRAALPGLRLVPEVFYEPLSLRLSLESNLEPSGSGTNVKVTVRSAVGGAPIPRVKVVGFTNFAARQGAEAFTSNSGVATLLFASRPASFERLYAFAEQGFWSGLRQSVSTAGALGVDLAPIDLGQPHALRHYFGEPDLSVGDGVSVGVIDTGCGPHPDLVITDGFNAVTGENPTQFGDNGDQHGTHVAGIIASRGAAPTGMRGLAPGVKLFAYRVFPKGQNASNFDIAKAIDRAREQGCDLINLSLGRPAAALAGADEPLVRIALEDARDAGVLAIAAAGNDFRQGVSFPGADDLCVAVSALGNRTVLVEGSVSSSAFAGPPGANPSEFISDFSNIGPEVDVTGPGVGVVSTVPNGDFAVMDGTSMASPAVTGVAARLLASKPAILGLPKGAARAAALATALLASAQSRGFTPPLEGRGLPT